MFYKLETSAFDIRRLIYFTEYKPRNYPIYDKNLKPLFDDHEGLSIHGKDKVQKYHVALPLITTLLGGPQYLI